MKAGFYECDITPAIGMERPATYHKIFIEKINDPLKARAVIFDNGKTKIALVGADICFLSGKVTEKVRAALPGMTVTLSPSHTHYGGPMSMAPDWLDNAPELIRKLVKEESVCENPDYTSHLVSQIVTAVKMADSRLEEVDFSFGKGKVEGVTFNRGFRMKDGHRATHPGKGNPEIVEPFAPIDTEAGVVGCWRKNGDFLGCVVNFSCHGTCDGTGATADWPGQMARTIKAVLGEDSWVVYLYGTAGDITQIDNQSLSPYESGPEYSKKVGVTVGAEVLKVLMQGKKGTVNVLEAHSGRLRIPRRKPSEESLKKALETVQQWKRDTAFHFAKERLILAEIVKREPEFDMELQLVQLGPLLIVAIPGEVFCGIGLEIKKNSKFPFTWASSLANDLCGYIPTPDVLSPETGGGYESRLTVFTCCVPEAAESIVRKVSEMMKEFTPAPVPEESKIEPVTTVWEFGNCPPELE